MAYILSKRLQQQQQQSAVYRYTVGKTRRPFGLSYLYTRPDTPTLLYITALLLYLEIHAGPIPCQHVERVLNFFFPLKMFVLFLCTAPCFFLLPTETGQVPKITLNSFLFLTKLYIWSIPPGIIAGPARLQAFCSIIYQVIRLVCSLVY